MSTTPRPTPTCPDCGEHRFSEVNDAVIYYPVDAWEINPNGKPYADEYGTAEWPDDSWLAEENPYFCENCHNRFNLVDIFPTEETNQ